MLKAGIIACLACAAALLLAGTGAGVQQPSTATTGASSRLPAKANVSSFLELHGNAHLENLPVAIQTK